jgi:hypothetical protein
VRGERSAPAAALPTPTRDAAAAALEKRMQRLAALFVAAASGAVGVLFYAIDA